MGKYTDQAKQGAVKLKSGVTSHLSTFFIGVMFIAIVIMFVVLGAFTFNVEALIPVATTLVGLPIIGSWFMGFVSEGSILGINWYTVSYMFIAALGMWYLSKRYYLAKVPKMVEVEEPRTVTNVDDPEEKNVMVSTDQKTAEKAREDAKRDEKLDKIMEELAAIKQERESKSA